MINTNTIPSTYIPFKTLTVCSNKFINGKIPFEINGVAPILVGKGESTPLVWLQVPTNKKLDSWQYIVRENRPLHKLVTIDINDQKISIKIDDILIIDAITEGNEIANIVWLDLRPIGINIYGETKSLFVGNNQMKSNTFENVEIMFGLTVED